MFEDITTGAMLLLAAYVLFSLVRGCILSIREKESAR